MKFDCPTCKAKPQNDCTTTSGARAKPHRPRRDLVTPEQKKAEENRRTSEILRPLAIEALRRNLSCGAPSAEVEAARILLFFDADPEKAA